MSARAPRESAALRAERAALRDAFEKTTAAHRSAALRALLPRALAVAADAAEQAGYVVRCDRFGDSARVWMTAAPGELGDEFVILLWRSGFTVQQGRSAAVPHGHLGGDTAWTVWALPAGAEMPGAVAAWAASMAGKGGAP